MTPSRVSSHPEPLAWLNGEFLAHRDARLPVWDMGIVQAVTVTEAVRTFRHLPFRLEAHFDRLRESLDAIGVSPSTTLADLRDCTQKLIAHNTGLISATADLAAILFVTAGESPLHSAGFAEHPGRPTVCIYSYPLSQKSAARLYREGLSLVVPSIQHIPPSIIDPRIKTRSRLHWYLADLQVRHTDPQAEALLLDVHGFATETAKGNLFALFGNSLKSPRPEMTLAGISQQVVEELAPQLGLNLERADLAVDQLLAADELWISSTTTCLVPVTRLNGQVIGSGAPGPVWKRTIEAWSQMVGMDIVGQAELATQETAVC